MMKNPVSTWVGIVQVFLTLILGFMAVVFPNALGIDWSDVNVQTAITAAVMGIANGVFGLLQIFKFGDKGGGV